MDLILLEPGNKDIFGGDNSWANGESLIDNKDDIWQGFAPPSKNLGQCFQLLSVHQGMKQQITTDVSNSARTSGRPIVTEFTCVKYVDKTSVKLYEYCLRAEPHGLRIRRYIDQAPVADRLLDLLPPLHGENIAMRAEHRLE